MSKHILHYLLAVFIGLLPGLIAANEALDLEGMSVLGNQELPKSLYIVPWKAPAPVDGEFGLSDSLMLNQPLTPIERNEFRRSLEYYDALHGSQ